MEMVAKVQLSTIIPFCYSFGENMIWYCSSMFKKKMEGCVSTLTWGYMHLAEVLWFNHNCCFMPIMTSSQDVKLKVPTPIPNQTLSDSLHLSFTPFGEWYVSQAGLLSLSIEMELIIQNAETCMSSTRDGWSEIHKNPAN